MCQGIKNIEELNKQQEVIGQQMKKIQREMQLAVDVREELGKKKGDKQSGLESLQGNMHSEMQKHQKQLLELKKKSDALKATLTQKETVIRQHMQ